MLEQKEVVVDREILNGNPHVKGTKLTVFDVISDCKHDGIKEYLNTSLDEIFLSDLQYVFEYCKTRQCVKDGSHCGGCSLRLEQDGIVNEADFVNRFATVRFCDSDEVLKGTGEGTIVMPGTAGKLSQTWRGEDGWLIALELLEKIK